MSSPTLSSNKIINFRPDASELLKLPFFKKARVRVNSFFSGKRVLLNDQGQFLEHCFQELWKMCPEMGKRFLPSVWVLSPSVIIVSSIGFFFHLECYSR